jgi:hypothetical protein
MCPWLVLGFYVPLFLTRPAEWREYQPKSDGAPATERGRAPNGRTAHTILLGDVFLPFLDAPPPWTVVAFNLFFPLFYEYFLIIY